MGTRLDFDTRKIRRKIITGCDSSDLWMRGSGLKITAGQRTMSGQNDDLSGQNFGSAVILTGHVHSFQISIS